MPLASLESTATLAVRNGIAWGLDKPEEDSSVLVIGTPSGHYIDIRFALSGPSTQGPFWAFAGKSSYTTLSTARDGMSGGWGQVVRGEWAHPIDSMGNFEGKDYADVITLQNGDQIETGVLEHPETGKPTQFKEYWTRPEDWKVVTPIVRAVFIENEEEKGVMIRVGSWVQAIRQISNDKVEVARWRQTSGQWEEDALSKQAAKEFPIDWIRDARTEGDSTTCAGRRWSVVEIA